MSRPAAWSSTRSPRRRSPRRWRHPRDLDRGLVDAYQTRRVLDRLYGYEVSPVLWKKVMPRLSAGRVQSVATRLVVARERERIAFRPAAYWDLEAIFTPVKDDASDAYSFPGRLAAVDGRRVAQGRDFSSAGELRNPDLLYLEGAAPAGDAAPPPPAANLTRQASSTGCPRPPSPTGWTACPSRSRASSVSRTAAPRTRRSAPRRCSRRRPASWASPPSTRCPRHNGSTRTATSPICGPTRSRSRRPPSARPVRRPGSCTGPSTCRTRPASTPAR